LAESTWQLVASLVIMPVVGKYVCMYVVLVFQNGMVFQGSLKWPIESLFNVLMMVVGLCLKVGPHFFGFRFKLKSELESCKIYKFNLGLGFTTCIPTPPPKKIGTIAPPF
jgi:hypothetical protein